MSGDEDAVERSESEESIVAGRPNLVASFPPRVRVQLHEVRADRGGRRAPALLRRDDGCRAPLAAGSWLRSARSHSGLTGAGPPPAAPPPRHRRRAPSWRRSPSLRRAARSRRSGSISRDRPLRERRLRERPWRALGDAG